MLRKFFHIEENNAVADDAGSAPTSPAALSDHDAGFADLEARLDVFDGAAECYRQTDGCEVAGV